MDRDKSRNGEKWTKEELQQLKKEYKKIELGGDGDLTIADIAEKHKRSKSAITNKAYEEGLNQADPWTDGELALLIRKYSNNDKAGNIELERLSEEIGRSTSNICRKARRLGLTNENREKSDELRNIISENSKEWLKNNEHPKGMEGKSHSQALIEKMKVERVKTECPTCGKELYVRPKELENGHDRYCSLQCAYNDPDRTKQTKESIKKQLKTKREKGNLAHNNSQGKRGDLDGQYFRSSWEANYARFLNLRGIDWEYEPKTFEFKPIERGTRFYTPDFYLSNQDKWIEVKGWFNKKSQTKIKRFKKYYQGEFEKLTIVVRSLDHKNAGIANQIGIPEIESYNAIKGKAGDLISNWE